MESFLKVNCLRGPCLEILLLTPFVIIKLVFISMSMVKGVKSLCCRHVTFEFESYDIFDISLVITEL